MRKGLPARTVILTYHDMVPRRDRNALWFDCTPGELTAQLDFLERKGAKFVSLDRLYRHLTGEERLPERAVAITFADNYVGFYRLAWPILKRRGIPVAMFVHTGHVGSTKGRPKMTWDQLRELDRSGLVTVASQTVSHPADLTKLNAAAREREMVDSKVALERELGHAVRYLAYPNGKFDGASAAAAKVAGYTMAFTEVQEPAEQAPSILLVPRYVHTRYEKAAKDAAF